MDITNDSTAPLFDDSEQTSFEVVCDHCATGFLRPARIRTALWQGTRLVVVRGIPAMVCRDCGEEYVDDQTVDRIDRMRGNGFRRLEAVEHMIVPVYDFGEPG